jgi:hypothetical protein
MTTLRTNILRALIEAGFIMFVFYSNLPMGEYERSGMGQTKGSAWAIGDVLTMPNFLIGSIAALSATRWLSFCETDCEKNYCAIRCGAG